jgi:hypothetical protein
MVQNRPRHCRCAVSKERTRLAELVGGFILADSVASGGLAVELQLVAQGGFAQVDAPL